MEDTEYNNENSAGHRVLQNEKRKPVESPFSAFSPAQRLAKKKGRILREPGDSNLEASMMDDSILETEESTITLPTKLVPKTLFAEGDGVDEETADIISDFDRSIVDETQGDRTFSRETRPVVPSSSDPNLDETLADTTLNLNETYSTVVRPVVPSEIDPNLDETLAELTMNETFSAVVRPVVQSLIDPNMDETLAETTINQTQLSMGDESSLVPAGDMDEVDESLNDDADVTLNENEKSIARVSLFEELAAKETSAHEQSVVAASLDNSIVNGGGMSLFDELNSVPSDVTIGEKKDESTVGASLENSLLKEEGGVSLFEELNNRTIPVSTETKEEEEKKEESVIESMKVNNEGTSLLDKMVEASEESSMDSSTNSTLTAIEPPIKKKVDNAFYGNMKQRLSDMNTSIVAPQSKPDQMAMETEEDDAANTTPTLSDAMNAEASPPSEQRSSRRFSLFNDTLTTPNTPNRVSSSNKYNAMNESHLSFIIHEAECATDAYKELMDRMKEVETELASAREHAEKMEKERDIAKKESDDYVFMMEETKKRMMNEKNALSRQIVDLESDLADARRVSCVVEMCVTAERVPSQDYEMYTEEARKVQEMEARKIELEERMKNIEDEMNCANEQFIAEKSRLSSRVNDMEKLMEEERKSSRDEMEKRVNESRIELEKKMEEILMQKNSLIDQLESLQRETGDQEYTNEETTRRLEGEKAMLETSLSNLQRDHTEMEEELKRVRMENEEMGRKLVEVSSEFEGMKSALVEMEQVRNAAFEESRHVHELSGEVEELKASNDEMMRKLNEKEEELSSIRRSLNEASTSSEGRIGEMEEKMKELEKEKMELEKKMETMKVEIAASSKVEEMMGGFMKMTNDQRNEAAALKEEIFELKMKIKDLESDIKLKEREVEVRDEKIKEREAQLEKIREESDMKMTSLESDRNSAQMRINEMQKSLEREEQTRKTLESQLLEMEGRIESGKNSCNQLESEMREVKESMEKTKGEMNSVIEEKSKVEEEMKRMNEEKMELKGRMEIMEIEYQKEKEKAVLSGQSEESLKSLQMEMEGLKENLKSTETCLDSAISDKNEANGKLDQETKQNVEMRNIMEKMREENEEMKRQMEIIFNEKAAVAGQSNEAMKSIEEELKKQKEEMETLSGRMSEMEEEKERAERAVQSEIERNEVLSDTVKELEKALDHKSTSNTSIGDVNSSKLKEELEEERSTVMRLKKEVKRLEETCDEFDDIENDLKGKMFEMQKKIDVLEGKKKEVGPALLNALKPTTTEIRAMDETVVVTDKKEDEEMKEEEYGTPNGSIADEDERKNGVENTLGVTKMEATRLEEEEDEYEKKNGHRQESCRQS
ncbi:hypothetical protein PFISCL1PPCAC_14843 [Pristionchus fissidentatus]|uniref:Uncharacterized protein n=1 Tax=Pristionchus fissidentatus TaxID=1538716 RepID=A0AAV5VVK1_9BILA|nr:hypothetical protein PFISCL1PPCAC_14843 [Pristionchus fissidentatus]